MAGEQTVRLRFLGDAGEALLATNTVTTGVRKLSAAQKEQAASSRVVAAESGRASAGMRTLERDIGKTSRGALAGSGIFRGLGRSVAFASASFLGGYGLLAAVRGAVHAMQEAAGNAIVTRQELLATGGAAGVTAKQIDVLAEATLRKTGYDKQLVVGAEDVLLKFTEVRNEVGRGNDVYTRAVKLTADLARAQKTDLATAASQLGRALNDPVRGLTALTRAGIQFTAAQREQIRALVDSGRIVEAQKIILDSVAGKVGGVAAAYGKQSGQIDVLRGEIRDLAGDYAKVLTPDINDAVKAGQEWVHHMETDKEARKEFRNDVVGIAHAVRDAAHLLHDMTNAIGGTKNALELLLGFKVAGVLAGWTAGFTKLIGVESAAGAEGAGLLGAAGGAALLRTRLASLAKIGPIRIAIILSVIDQATGGHIFHWMARDKSNPIVWLEDEFGKLIQMTTGYKGFRIPDSGAGAATQKTGTPSDIQPGAGGLTKQQKGIVATAKSKLGQPYVWGGTSWDLGMDCSGFTQQVMARNGVSIPRTSQQQAAGGVPVPMDQLIPGDLVFSEGWPHPGHVAVYVGGGQVIEDPHTGAGVRYTSVANFQHARRYLKIVPVPGGSTGGKGGAGKTPVGPAGGTRPPRGTQNPPPTSVTIPLDLQKQLALAGTTKALADDKAALRAIIAWFTKLLAGGGLTEKQQIDALTQEGSFISQLDALTPAKKKPKGKASAAALINIHHTLDAVAKLVDEAGLGKVFDAKLEEINDELSKKFVTTATLARVRNQLSDISKAVAKELAKAKAAVAANKKAFADQWAQLASDAFAAFDKETAAHVSPSRALLNALVDEHDAAARQKALADAQAQLQQALAGKTGDTSGQLDQIRTLVGQAALANAIDKAQSQVLGIAPQEIGSGALINQLQQLLVTQLVPDQQAVAAAQQAVDDAQYNIRVADLGKLADAEDQAYADGRAALRDALQAQLDEWGSYYAKIGEDARHAAADFAMVWSSVLAEFPTSVGGTGGVTGASGTPTVGQTVATPGGVAGGSFYGVLSQFNPTQFMAAGGEGVALSPTLFVAGERGPENYKFTPLSSSTSGRGDDHAYVHLSLGEPLDSLVESKIIEATPRISILIGQQADTRRRGNRI